MSDLLRTPQDYELFLYTLKERFPSIRRSTVTFIRRGASLALVTGELHFDDDISASSCISEEESVNTVIPPNGRVKKPVGGLARAVGQRRWPFIRKNG